MIDVKAMTDDDLSWTLSVIAHELDMRREKAAIPAKMGALNREYLAAAGVEDGAGWVQPTGAHDAYPEGWEVEHKGKTWVSLTPGNVWEPGVSGWREKVAAPDPAPESPESPGVEGPAPAAAWVQPTGAHDAYAVGERVAHGGKVWANTTAANVWEPGVYGWTEEA